MLSRNAAPKRRFLKQCGCELHEADSHTALWTLSGHIRRAPIQELIRRGLITEKEKYICVDCFQRGSDLLGNKTRQCFDNDEIHVMDTHNDNTCSFEWDNDCHNECDSDACVIDNDCSRVDIVECDDGSVDNDDDLNMDCGAEYESTLHENRWEVLNETQTSSVLSQAKELGRLIYSDLYTDSKNILRYYRTNTQDQREWLSDRTLHCY